ncbi:hypothetical protein SAV14893_057570 [Streptomyces avermitilis]|uniref:Uncharacterized protein n=1 Tax=Streptomyces avermitilis TaxID=33903 RepID=A0A4D4MMY6_STRAX|nr:hypothetical protein SAVMC3_69820 [Streptomyces avermitilis]GDY66364.1 hypothetical protein SAV14893_057570 [Streptomyces avermitilis]GDY73410.1 hypothetical protein SAV31267_028950 [Streptomyces avermitilis]GDY82502.1 hypothetical protein SAVCW2_17010 [Streptomyces avermitilis]
MVSAVGPSQQLVDGPADDQREYERAADDDQRSQYVLHACERNRPGGLMNLFTLPGPGYRRRPGRPSGVPVRAGTMAS